MGTDDFSAEVRWHRICDDPFDSSSPDHECMSLTQDVRMCFTARHFFFSLRGATLIAKMIASEAGGAFEFAPSPDSLTTVPGTDQDGALGVCRFCACKIVCLVCGCNTCAADSDAPTPITVGTLCARARSRGLRCGDSSTLLNAAGPTPVADDCGDQAERDQLSTALFQSQRESQPTIGDENPWTLTGLADGDLIYSYGVLGKCTRFDLTVWLGSRAHLEDAVWPLIVGDLKANGAVPTGNDKLAEWSVCVEYAGEALGTRLTVPLPLDLASLVRQFDVGCDEILVRDGALRDHLRNVFYKASSFARAGGAGIATCMGLVPQALLVHIGGINELRVPDEHVKASSGINTIRDSSQPAAGTTTRRCNPVPALNEWLSTGARELESSLGGGPARKAHPEALVSNHADALASFKVRIGMVPVPASANDAEGPTVRSDQAERDQLNVALYQSEHEPPVDTDLSDAALYQRASTRVRDQAPTDVLNTIGAPGDGAAGIGFVGLGGLTSPPAAVRVPPAEQGFQLLTVAEFDKLIPMAVPYVPENRILRRAWQRSQSKPIWCDVLGTVLFLHGDTFVIKSLLKQARFKWNQAVKRWEHRWSLALAQTVMSWQLGSIVITFSPAVEARARRDL
jgi:hypothetical protein